MIRVTVELIEFGAGTPKVIGVMDIINTGEGTVKNGKYRAYSTLDNKENHMTEIEHKRSDSVWILIYKTLKKMIKG